ncbi:MAG: T9SS type A sorting domain-containing protein [Bacteroidota bacterium]|nr:T9SS type A sorting domain-containing protein [Bacteroidota bacterium]
MYAPVGITAPAFATDEFMAQYFFRLAHNDGYDSTQHDLSLNHLSRAEYWLLNRTAGTSAAKVSLGWKAGRSGAVDVLSDLRVARWNGTSWKDEGNGGTTGTMEEGTIQTLNPISTFSPFTLASSTINNPLPVVYIYFTVSLQPNRTVLLKWETGTETGNVYFEIERSADSRAWSAIATVHSNASHLYSFTDAAPAKGVNYYRIKQVDQDGAWSYTTTRLVRISNDNKIFVWPNPVTDNLYVQVPLTGGLLEIIEAGGRIVQTQVISNTITTIPVQQLANGVYILRVKQGTEAFTEKFIKQ